MIARANAWGLMPDELGARRPPGAPQSIFRALHRPWTWDGVTSAPAIGKETRDFLASSFDTRLPEVVRETKSLDGATKLLLGLADGSTIESVHMPRAVRVPRVTLCLSSQVGCAIGCTFCATARMGLVRHLDAGEIVAQVLVMMRRLGPDRPQAVSIVFMGMGEPLHNLDNVAHAVRILCHPSGLGLSPNRITVSTSGIVPGIERLAAMGEPRPLLAVSLNAAPGAVRSRLMPIDKTYDAGALRAALERWPLRAGEKITVEYVLLAGTNDADRDADALADWIGGLRHNVNLIPFNRWDGAPFDEPEESRIQSFARRLQERGCLVTIRRSRGRDAAAACGQLSTLSEARSTRAPRRK